MVTTWKRRTISLTTLAVLALVGSPLLWLCLPLTLTYDLLGRRRFASSRLALFVSVFAWLEVLGLVGATICWLGRPLMTADRYLDSLYALQRWWALSILRLGRWVFSLNVSIEGPPLRGGTVLLSRHAGMLDTVLPFFLPSLTPLRPRYVLKDILKWDPCLDVVGQRLPNAFVRPGQGQSRESLARVAAIASGLTDRDTMVIFPEGTRFSQKRRARQIARARDAGRVALADKIASYSHILPARIGGFRATLEAQPTLGVTLLAHAGLDRTLGARSLWQGTLIGLSIHIRVRHIPSHEVPSDPAELESWLEEAWHWVDDAVREMHDGARTAQ